MIEGFAHLINEAEDVKYKLWEMGYGVTGTPLKQAFDEFVNKYEQSNR